MTLLGWSRESVREPGGATLAPPTALRRCMIGPGLTYGARRIASSCGRDLFGGALVETEVGFGDAVDDPSEADEGPVGL